MRVRLRPIGEKNTHTHTHTHTKGQYSEKDLTVCGSSVICVYNATLSTQPFSFLPFLYQSHRIKESKQPSPQPPVSNDYAYYQIMPAPCPPVMGFYQSFPGPYPGSVQAGVVNPVSAADVGERPHFGQAFGLTNQRGRALIRPPLLPKVTPTVVVLKG